MLPRLNSDILSGLVPSAAAAATPRGVEGCGALITSTNAYSHCVHVGSSMSARHLLIGATSGAESIVDRFCVLSLDLLLLALQEAVQKLQGLFV
jgi:hypothetical protein